MCPFSPQPCSENDSSSSRQVKTQRTVCFFTTPRALSLTFSPLHLALTFSLSLLCPGAPMGGPVGEASKARGPLASPIHWLEKRNKKLRGWWVALTLVRQCSGREKWGKYQWRWSHIAHYSMSASWLSEHRHRAAPGFAPLPLSSWRTAPRQK